MYPKNVIENIPAHVLRQIRGWRLRMAKAKRNIGREILQGLREIKRGQHGRVVDLPRVASIREKTGLSKERFATLLGVSVRTIQDWERGRRAPSGAARTLLLIAERNPKAPRCRVTCQAVGLPG
jgi:putative transcriptional regulator